MRKAILLICALVSASLFFSKDTSAKTPSHPEYLVMQNIGAFLNDGHGSCGQGAVYLAAVDHFNKDHEDITCETGYYNVTQDLAVEIVVTRHAGSDSDRWLRHEIDAEFRNYYGKPDMSYAVVPINGNYVMEFGSGGWDYRWLSGNTMIRIESVDLQMEKPEPLEVVKVYLAKYPSSLQPTTLTQLRSSSNLTIWINDEMERRLWLCDKWLVQLPQLDGKQQKEVIEKVVKCLNIFLDYREKYFRKYILFKNKAIDDKNLLNDLKSQQNTSAITEKLEEYKKWWRDNKTTVISF